MTPFWIVFTILCFILAVALPRFCRMKPRIEQPQWYSIDIYQPNGEVVRYTGYIGLYDQLTCDDGRAVCFYLTSGEYVHSSLPFMAVTIRGHEHER